MQTPHQRIFGLDLLRSSAILLVIFYHLQHISKGTPQWIQWICERGWIGVDLFFVLSGYLIASQLYKLDPSQTSWKDSLQNFWIKRWTRTLPLYFLVLCFYFWIKPGVLKIPFYGERGWYFFVFLQNFFLPMGDFEQSWSLCIEEQFYLVFPVIFLICRIRHPFLWLTPIALSLFLRMQTVDSLASQYVSHLSPDEINLWFRFATLKHLDGLSVGIFLAGTQRVWSLWSVKTKNLLATAGGLLSGFVLVAGGNDAHLGSAIWYFTGLAVGFGAMIPAATIWRRPDSRTIHWFVEKTALWSYGAYLWNNIMMRILARTFPDLSIWHYVVPALVMTLVLSAVTYRFVELPGMALRKRFLRES